MNLKYCRWWNLDAARALDASFADERAEAWWDIWGRIGRIAYWRLP